MRWKSTALFLKFPFFFLQLVVLMWIAVVVGESKCFVSVALIKWFCVSVSLFIGASRMFTLHNMASNMRAYCFFSFQLLFSLVLLPWSIYFLSICLKIVGDLPFINLFVYLRCDGENDMNVIVIGIHTFSIIYNQRLNMNYVQMKILLLNFLYIY